MGSRQRLYRSEGDSRGIGMVDTHCHIDLYPNPLVVASEAEKAKITTVAVTYLPSHYEMATQHLASFKFVKPALGLHPMSWKDHEKELPRFSRFAKSANFIGEIGLDFSQGGHPGREVQERSFVSILRQLNDRRRFITLHSRGAESEVLSHLQSANIHKVVFHWFSGSRSQVKRVLDAGHFLSINTAMIRTAKWDEFIGFVPRTSILTETDGPFVTAGKTPDTPGKVGNVLSWLGDRWKCSIDVAETQIQQTFESLLP